MTSRGALGLVSPKTRKRLALSWSWEEPVRGRYWGTCWRTRRKRSARQSAVGRPFPTVTPSICVSTFAILRVVIAGI